MGRQIKSSGKTIDEAIWNGIKELGCSIDEVTIETVQKGTSGILGIGAKPAIVLITEKDVEDIDVMDLFEKKKTSEQSQKGKSRVQRFEERQRERPTNVSKKTETHVSKPIATEAPVATAAPQNVEQIVDRASEPAPAVVEPEEVPDIYSEEAAKTNETAMFISELLKKMQVDAKVLAAEVDGALMLRIDSEAAGVLIGHRGETLDALQYLALLVANHNRNHKEYVRVSLDTQGYREKREETLIRLAKAKAATVRASNHPYKFEPMSPYERRIIHATLQPNAYVSTHSEGVEPYRYVVITSNRAQKKNNNYNHNK